MLVLGIESSCDETAVALVTDKREIRSHAIYSQLQHHAPYGGVVPEIAARAHIERIDELVVKALEDANVKTWDEVDAIAVAAGPGLIGGVIVGSMVAKGIAAALNKPIIAVNHLEGHALSVRITEDVPFPFLLLLVSGGHCQVLCVEDIGVYHCVGSTIDDALGEAFDKVAKMMGLGYPGGPIIEKYAKKGDAARFNFPRSMVGKVHGDFSFSGLKTAVKRVVDGLKILKEQDVADVAASFQACVADIVNDRIACGMRRFKEKYPSVSHPCFVVAGGVAANMYLRQHMEGVAANYGFALKAPPVALCTDNAAMIAWVGVERYTRGMVNTIAFTPKDRWPLAAEG